MSLYTGKIIDTHMHLWDLSKKGHYAWLKTDSPVMVDLVGNYNQIKHSFSIEDYIALIKNQNVVKSIHVEAAFDGNPVMETQWLQEISNQFEFPNGIVAHADLADPDVNEVLKQHCQYINMRGIRMTLNYDQKNPKLRWVDRDYLRDKQWKKGFSLLAKYNLIFDMQIFDTQIDDVISLVKEFPDNIVVINHYAWPLDISENHLKIWQERLERLAEHPNVFLKLSGIGWIFKKAEFNTVNNYTLAGIKAFGIDRCMFGSNCPPDELFYTFDDLVLTFKKIFIDYSTEEQHKLFYENANRIYRL